MVWNMSIFEFTDHDEVTFFPGRTPLSFSPEKYMYQVCDFLLFDKDEYTHRIFRSVILVSIFMLSIYVTFPLFFKIWLTESIRIFGE